MKKNIYFSLAVLGLLTASCGNSEKQNQDSNAGETIQRDTGITTDKEISKSVDTADLAFFKKAAMGGLTEIEASSRMLIVSKDSLVRTFAIMMVKDHNMVHARLSKLAKKKGISLPKVLSDLALNKVKNIDKYKDDGRNEYYAHMMATDHKETVDLFSAGSNSKDPEISAFAKQILPALLHHYKNGERSRSKNYGAQEEPGG